MIDEWQMHLNKSIAGIAHCKYHALVLLFYLASLQPPFKFLRAVRAASLSVTCGPTLLHFNLFHSAHRRRRCDVGCRGCCRGENHLRMSTPPVRCRLLALEYKPRSSSPARLPRRHDFARHHTTDLQPPNSGHTCLIWGALWCSIQPQSYFS